MQLVIMLYMVDKNLHLRGTSKFRNCFVGLAVITEHIGETVCHLDLLQFAAFKGVHNVLHVSLFYCWLSNRVHANVLPIKIDSKAEYKVTEIKGSHEQECEIQYLIFFAGFDILEDMRLPTT